MCRCTEILVPFVHMTSTDQLVTEIFRWNALRPLFQEFVGISSTEMRSGLTRLTDFEVVRDVSHWIEEELSQLIIQLMPRSLANCVKYW